MRLTWFCRRLRNHMVTERCQALGTREDAYAVTSDRYGDLHGALQCLIDDANLIVPRAFQFGSKYLQPTLY